MPRNPTPTAHTRYGDRRIGTSPAQRRRFAVTVYADVVPYLVPPPAFRSKYADLPAHRNQPIPQDSKAFGASRVVVGYASTLESARLLAADCDRCILARARFHDPETNREIHPGNVGDRDHASRLLRVTHDADRPRIFGTAGMKARAHWTPGDVPPAVSVDDRILPRVEVWGDLVAPVARTLYLLSYADAVENGQIVGPRPGAGEDWDDYAPDGASLSAYRAACRIVHALKGYADHATDGPAILSTLRAVLADEGTTDRIGTDLAHVAAGSGGSSGFYPILDTFRPAVLYVETFDLADDPYMVRLEDGPMGSEPVVYDRPADVRQGTK